MLDSNIIEQLEYVRFDYKFSKIRKQTEKAILLEYEHNDGFDSSWFPKSSIVIKDNYILVKRFLVGGYPKDHMMITENDVRMVQDIKGGKYDYISKKKR